ncbi:hypothetical protein [Pontibacter vulgaris]|uniref:hypothetical protein n=1 Tax=Pontibacter vulgaris TaxID=2905679 RepID=UPI001FA6FE1B|nr:hypothetical protein [Pontibacter vulgaris]
MLKYKPNVYSPLKFLSYIWPLLLLLSALACKPDDEIITTDPEAKLEFSGDTVLFDTVFVTQGSITKRLKVYNPNKKAVRISDITLAGTSSSPYKLTINGIESPLANNIELRGKDSIYILVKVTVNPSDVNLPFLVADSILFNTNGNRQQVKLVAYGQNAYFHRKVAIGTTTWPNDKPHVLLDTVLVQEGATLTIQKGTRVFAASKAVLLVNGRLLVEGTPTERVSFSGYRREPLYTEAPGQWEGIRILTKSENSSIKYADINNTVYGLRIGNPGKAGTLVEGCTVAYTFMDGIVSYTSDVKLVNTLIRNFGQYGFGGLGGGNYEVLYSTIVSYSNQLPRETPAFVVADFIPGTDIKNQPTSLRLINSIVYSDSFRDEVLLEAGAAAHLEITNNMLRTEKYKTSLNANGNKLNIEPKFKAIGKLDFSLDTLSPASSAARFLPEITTDIKGKKRSATTPDIGAYERSID